MLWYIIVFKHFHLVCTNGEFECILFVSVPSAPGNFVLSSVIQSSSTLSASWMKPDPQNGIISSYTIRCNTTTGPAVKIDLFDISGTTTTLENLTPFTEYVCVISANTSAGEGAASNSDSAITGEDGKY